MQTVENTTYTFKDFIQDHPELALTGNGLRPMLKYDELLDIMRSSKSEPFKYRLTLTNTQTDKSMSFDFSMGVGLLLNGWRLKKRERVSLPFSKAKVIADVEDFIKKYRPTPENPDLETALYSLASDSQALPNYECFEDWASEYGYDEDSREAERTYNLCIKQARELRDVLGREAFDQLLTCEEE